MLPTTIIWFIFFSNLYYNFAFPFSIRLFKYSLELQLIISDRSSHLDSVLRQLRLHGQHLPGVHVRVVGFMEGLLQLLQLVGREHRPAERRDVSCWRTPNTEHNQNIQNITFISLIKVQISNTECVGWFKMLEFYFLKEFLQQHNFIFMISF